MGTALACFPFPSRRVDLPPWPWTCPRDGGHDHPLPLLDGVSVAAPRPVSLLPVPQGQGMVALAVLLTVVPSVMVAAVAVAIAAAVVEGVMVTGAATAVVVVVSVVLTWLQLSVDPLTLARFGRVSRPL